MMRPRPAVLMLILSGMTLIATPLAIAVAGSTDMPVTESIGDRHASVVAAPPTAPPVIDLSQAVAPGVSITAIERADAAVYAPTSISIPALNVKAQIVPVGLDDAQAVQVPDDISTVGWFSLGVAPGSAVGSAVIVGHRDGVTDGHGAFYDLARLSPGDQIHVRDASGRRLDYEVVSREVVARQLLPTQDLFAVDGSPRLTLITCGGYYAKDAGGYQANVIVTAVPVA